MKITKWLSVLAGLCLLTLFSPAQTVETRDGVRFVRNKGKDLKSGSSGIKLEKVGEIGDIEAPDESVAFYMPLDIALDVSGNLYVLDTGNHRIQKFAPDGTYLATYGRKGQGPGEFNFPGSLDIDNQGNMIVASPFIKKIQFLNPDGEETESLTLAEGIADYVRILADDRYLTGVRRRFPLPGEDNKSKELGPLVQVMNGEGKMLQKYGQPRDYRDGLVNATANRVNFAVGEDGSFYLAYKYQNRLEKYSADGQLLWIADRELNYDASKPVNKGKIDTSGGGISIRSPTMNACSESLDIDGNGRIWVISLKRQLERDERGGTNINMSRSGGQSSIAMSPSTNSDIMETDAYVLEVYDPEGVLLDRFALDHFSDMIRISGDRIYILDKIRRMQIHIYRIIGW